MTDPPRTGFLVRGRPALRQRSAPRVPGMSSCPVGSTCLLNPTGTPELLITSKAIKLRGKHNLLNIAAAALASLPLVPTGRQLPRRSLNIRGWSIVWSMWRRLTGGLLDDSFATSPEPTIVALRAFSDPVVLIAGGADKGTDYTGLAEEILNSSVKAIVLIGQMGPLNRAAVNARAEQTKRRPPVMVDGGREMKTIVAIANQYATPGDVVLLSTACASFDLFKNYKERGALFKEEVWALKDE